MGAKRVSKQGVTVTEGNAIEVTNTAGTALFSVNSTGNINTLANLTAKGSILTASAANTPTTLAVGTNEHRLVANSATTSGLAYVADTTNYAINAKGDLLVGTAADTVTNLAVASTAGWVLTVDSATTSGLKWAVPATPAFVGVGVRINGTSIAYTSNVINYLPFTSEDFDTDAFHNNSTNTSRITIPSGKDGKYLITGTVYYTPGSTYLGLNLRKNGNTDAVPAGYLTLHPNQASNSGATSFAVILSLVATDYLELGLRLSSTANYDTYVSWQAQFLGA